MRLFLRTIALSLVALHFASANGAYPQKPITLIVPFASGGASDSLARVISVGLGRELGQAVNVENRAGAGGSVAAEAVKSASPDGYTLLLATTGILAINPAIYRTLKYDPVRDFAPIGTVASTGNILVVNRSVGVRTVADLIALAKSRPGRLTYGSSGVGSSSHVSGALFASLAGVELVHVPYRGSTPAIEDLLRGRLEMMFDTAGTQAPHIRSGRVLALAVTGAKRVPLIPDVPTLSESGLPGYDISIWFGLVAPLGTPQDVVERLSGALSTVLDSTDTQQALNALEAEPLKKSPSDFAQFLLSEVKRWKATTSAAGSITLD
jgi:tripartite-type tricarboxylate transporter receptor subunit TctC